MRTIIVTRTTPLDYLARIKSDPEICGGKPCVAGTRMRVCDILDYMSGGDTVDDLLEHFPYISREDILACLAFAADRCTAPISEADSANLSDRLSQYPVIPANAGTHEHGE